MCVVSTVGDFYNNRWIKQTWYPSNPPTAPYAPILPEITRAEFDNLRREVEEMKELLIRAKKYDEENGEPDCEMDDKLKVLRKVAEMVGIDLEDVLGSKPMLTQQDTQKPHTHLIAENFCNECD